LAYGVTIWFVKIDGATWIGSLSTERAWVKNLRATGKAALDFGDGPRPVRAVWVDGAGGVARYEAAVREKYPITSRSLPSFSRQHPRTCRECDIADSRG